MRFKDTINTMVKPKMNNEGLDKISLPISENMARKSDQAVMHKTRSSLIENVQYNDLNLEINQKDIDQAAKKYHRNMKNRQRQRNGEEEIALLQPGLLSVSTHVLFNETQVHQPEAQQEVPKEIKQEISTRSHLRSHLRHQKYRRSQITHQEHGQCRQTPQERERRTGAQESPLRRLKQLKQRLERLAGYVEDHETLNLNHGPFRSQEVSLQEANQGRIGSPKEQTLQDETQKEQTQNTNAELTHRTQRLQKHALRQPALLESPELLSESEETSSEHRRRLYIRQQRHNTLSETSREVSSRQRIQRNLGQEQNPQNNPAESSDADPVPLSRHTYQRHSQADHALLEAGLETCSRQRRQRYLAQQHGPPESLARLCETDSEPRLRHPVQHNNPQEPLQRHALLQGIDSESTQRQLRSPISNEIVNEELRASKRISRVQNPSRILHPCDRFSSSKDHTPEGPPNHEDGPPSDEYYAGNEAEIPPYHATLHKYLDLISYDPRVVPCLRVNRSLIKSNDKLSDSIFQFLKFNLFPESIDPWEISHIDDQHYDDLIPDLIPVDNDSSDVLPNIPYEYNRHHNDVAPQIISDDDYEYALYLSTLENNVHDYSTGIGLIRG